MAAGELSALLGPTDPRSAVVLGATPTPAGATAHGTAQGVSRGHGPGTDLERCVLEAEPGEGRLVHGGVAERC